MSLEQFALVVSILLLISTLVSKAIGRYGVPSLLIFLVIGMLAGSEGPGGIYFDDPVLAQALGVVALVFILFAGGLDTDWNSVRPTLTGAFILVTLGVGLTAVLVGLFAYAIMDFTLLEAMLLGSIVSSTDAAAVFAILRSKGVGLRRNIKPMIELESATNDPMAIFLTTAFIGLINSPEASVATLVPMFFQQMLLGALLGYIFGRLSVMLLNRVNLAYEGLYPVITMAIMLGAYSATSLINGNGFLAVFFAGLVMGNSEFIHKRSLLRFHDGMAWLMQMTMFMTLGLLVFPSRLTTILWQGLAISAFLILVARPIGVIISLLPVRMRRRDKTMVSWVGLRGAVPIVLATFPLIHNIDAAGIIFDLVFFIVLTSVLIQGTSIPLVAKWLGVDKPLRARPRSPIEFEATEGMSGNLEEVEVSPLSHAVGKQLVELALPKGALFVLIERDHIFVVPRGNTILEAGDNVMVLADEKSLEPVKNLLEVAAEQDMAEPHPVVEER